MQTQTIIDTCLFILYELLHEILFIKLSIDLLYQISNTQNFGDSKENSSDPWNRLYEKKTLASSRREVFHHDPQVNLIL